MRKYFSLILSVMLATSLLPQNIMAQQTNNVITKENTKISVYENNSDASIAQSDNSETNENLVYVTGDIVSDDGSNVVTWTKDKTYVVCSKNIVELPYVKCKLVIEPGTTVLFGTGTGNVNGVENSDVVYRPYSIFRVEEGGSIEAKGTQDEPIVFKNIDTHAGWNGIEITLPDNGEVTDTFEYCYFINGGAQFRDFTEGLIDVSHGTKNTKFNLTVDHCIFDSTELVSKNILQPSEIGAGFFYGDYDANTVESNIKISNSMDTLKMGDAIAISLGENIKVIKSIATIVVILLSSSSVAIAGPISFIGLITPHIVIKLGARNFRESFILCGIYGANLLLLSDIISKILKYPYESPVGIVTAFMGAVFYIILANKEMKRGGVSEK